MRYTLAFATCAMPVMAQELRLDQPIDCTLGETCYLQNYVDHDPTQGVSDFQCGALSYDGHKGTDFALPSRAAMEAGVSVLAAAPGLVRGVRNDMRDVLYTPDLEDDLAGRECGNGVVIAHEGGWETQYCHMSEGSVTVQTGDVVAAGDRLGLVGLSGRTQFPHLHISVRRNGEVIDPFDPDGQITCATPSNDSLWIQSLETPPGGLINVGFADRVPDYEEVKAGTGAAEELTPGAPIVLWGFAFGAMPGDILTIRFSGPNGPVFQTDDVLDRQQALVFRAGGLNAPDGGWPPGTYRGTVTHRRAGGIVDEMAATITLD